ncbi:MAG: sulfotransferase [Pseudomonadota bacterium]
MTKAPILISGCPRSGTTFCGNIISKSPEIFEVYEPFNHDFTYDLNLPTKFFRFTESNQAAYRGRLDRMMQLADRGARLKLLPQGGLGLIRAEKDMVSSLALKKLAQDRESFFKASRLSMKDPIAFYSSEWLAEVYDARVVMMCRHPGGVVSSYLTLGWEAETKYIIDHPLPGEEGQFDSEIDAWRRNPEDTIGAVILQWKLFTQATLDLQARHPDWFFCLHDQLCDHPVDVFRAMFKAVDLPFTDAIEAQIIRDTGAANVVDPHQHTQHSLQRQSSELKQSWRKRLDAESADRILRATEALWTKARAAFALPLEVGASQTA